MALDKEKIDEFDGFEIGFQTKEQVDEYLRLARQQAEELKEQIRSGKVRPIPRRQSES
ncbi:hypothetical protein Pse7367_2708 [Thalassoporum mexicanum PCC 7367]|uniref:hypothetical protein n=1 Tax=Thalassoporum mexicanum TaxID=3457544 RepID=UPI00029FA080|nr:hypothetical protein [Pseudanabaena sp. PCC 7367]AFY70963.1 hypothetical protein Pse7367_2708 [Pseudanabaena sp. PCC 7367]